MKWPYYVKSKIKVACVLSFIIAIILVSVLTVRKSFSKLDHSISSIYQDRLMPATYIFQITNHLYQKRLLQEKNDNRVSQQILAEHSLHNEAIAKLITDYEKTFLTSEEQEQWLNFKSSLSAYQNMEEKALSSASSGMAIALPTTQLLEEEFSSTLFYLNALSKIQAGEGSDLQKSSRKIISGNIITSNLEISLLIVLCLYTLILLSASDHLLFKTPKNTSLN